MAIIKLQAEGINLADTFNFTGTVTPNNTPAFSIYNTASQSISNASETKLSFNTADLDTDSGFDSSNNRWTVPTGEGGEYFVSFRYIWSGTWGARIIAYVKKNGGGNILGMQADKERVDGGVHVNGLVTLSAGDYLEGYVYQDSGSTQGTVGGLLWNQLSGYKLIGV